MAAQVAEGCVYSVHHTYYISRWVQAVAISTSRLPLVSPESVASPYPTWFLLSICKRTLRIQDTASLTPKIPQNKVFLSLLFSTSYDT